MSSLWVQNVVKSLTDIFVISLRIKTVSQRGHKQLFLSLLLIFTTAIELILILTRMLDVQFALREIYKILLPEQFASKVTQGTILGVGLN